NKPFRFPSEYYDICTSNYNIKRKNIWFSNRSLSPEINTSAVQDKTVSSSDDSLEQQQNTPALETELIVTDNESTVTDDVVDPDYNPSRSDSSSEISLTSPQIFCSPEDLSSPETLAQDNSNELVYTRTEPAATQNNDELDNFISKTTNTKKTVFCYYCESYVLNFPRHLSRNHKTELDVQKILALPSFSKERKNLLYSLRKKGNYLNSNEVSKPVRKGADASNYLPCTHCLGFYSARNLWRHRKQCDANPAKGTSARNSQTDAQNFLIRHLRVDPQLKTDIFPRMRADQVSLVAKKDPLICAFASRYLKIHREKHFVLVTSRKMRELARLLIEAKKIKPSITDLFGALKPENYDVLVSATKAASRYDPDNNSYEAPTFALQIGTTLKQCCDVALVHALKKSETFPTIQSANTEGELKTLSQLIKGNWKFDVSTQAANDLNLQKLNKVSLVPLASDLKLLKNCLIDKANAALLKLNQNTRDANAYIVLLETIYCRLLLLNRRRPGELQRFFIKTYKSAFLNQNTQAYEEFSEAISETEKILMNNFKRIRDEDLVEENEVINGDEASELTNEHNFNSEIKKKPTGRKRLLVPWTENQKQTVTTYFKTHIKQKRPPKKAECDDIISKHPALLKNKDWLKIKVFVQNKYKKQMKIVTFNDYFNFCSRFAAKESKEFFYG
ncbi:hypothetical protein NQ314_019957, partial [Rhamnusium bicolor]